MARANGSDQPKFGRPDRGKEASSRRPKGRMCVHGDCQTILSTYNASDVCWLHTPPSYRHALSRS